MQLEIKFLFIFKLNATLAIYHEKDVFIYYEKEHCSFDDKQASARTRLGDNSMILIWPGYKHI